MLIRRLRKGFQPRISFLILRSVCYLSLLIFVNIREHSWLKVFILKSVCKGKAEIR
jgi:hypothetical protein